MVNTTSVYIKKNRSKHVYNQYTDLLNIVVVINNAELSKNKNHAFNSHVAFSLSTD